MGITLIAERVLYSHSLYVYILSASIHNVKEMHHLKKHCAPNKLCRKFQILLNDLPKKAVWQICSY